MASQSSNDPGGMISGINVTPLVDIMLVLLIIFMVTAKLTSAPATAVPLELPKASSAQAVQVVFSLQLFADGTTTANGQPVKSDAALLQLAKQERAAHPGVRAVIQADGHVYHQRIVQVMDLLSQAEIAQVAFGAVRTQENLP